MKSIFLLVGFLFISSFMQAQIKVDVPRQHFYLGARFWENGGGGIEFLYREKNIIGGIGYEQYQIPHYGIKDVNNFVYISLGGILYLSKRVSVEINAAAGYSKFWKAYELNRYTTTLAPFTVTSDPFTFFLGGTASGVEAKYAYHHLFGVSMNTKINIRLFKHLAFQFGTTSNFNKFQMGESAMTFGFQFDFPVEQ